MNVINRQFILQYTISITKSLFSNEITESFINLQAFQQENKGTMANIISLFKRLCILKIYLFKLVN
jgi:hypothetical protein